MIREFVDRFMNSKQIIKREFEKDHVRVYKDIVSIVIRAISSDAKDSFPDPERIHEIDDGDYQGTLVYVIGEKGYQPSEYWYVKIGYGSCSGCDSLKDINEFSKGKPTEEEVNKYMLLALHVVQGLKRMGDDDT